MSLNLLTTLPKKRTEMQIICSGVDGIKVQLWEAVTRYRTRISENGLRGRIGVALVKTVLCQKGGTLPLSYLPKTLGAESISLPVRVKK